MAEGLALLIAGTTSDAGKSIIVAGLCRAFARAGLKVAPFKAQNMANNSVLTSEGREIGRAQALQALACGLEPSVDFNPILLKPSSDKHSQLIIRGKVAGEVGARDYTQHQRRQNLRKIAVDTLSDLRQRFDLVICEGAGSPAEINLRETDIANFGLAQAAGLPVYIVGDIDRGGVLAHLFGTHAIVSQEDRDLIQGFVINKFRGEQSILDPGLEELADLTGVETKAVLPFINGLWVDAEDSLQIYSGAVVGPGDQKPLGRQRLQVAAIRLPRVSNTTDIEALAAEPGVSVTWAQDADQIATADLVVLPGTQAVGTDLEWLEAQGLAGAVGERLRQQQPVLAIDGGCQILARLSTLGPVSTEDSAGEAADLWSGSGGFRKQAVFSWEKQPGLLEDDAVRRYFLTQVAELSGRTGFVVSPDTCFKELRLQQLDLIADVLEEHWDLDQLLEEVANPEMVAKTPESM